MRLDTATAIESIAMDTLGVNPGQLRAARTLDEAGIDSLGAIDLIFAIETHFGVLIESDVLSRVTCLQDLVSAVEHLMPDVDCVRVA